MRSRYSVPEHRGHVITRKLSAILLGKLCQIRRRIFQRGSRRSVYLAIGPRARRTVGVKHFSA
jgi:hypothetical protein